MIYVTKKEFKERYGNGWGICTKINGENTIVIPYHTNTRIRLHEISHLQEQSCNRQPLKSKFDDALDCELEAEIFAYNKMGRPLHLNVALPAINLLSEFFHDAQYTNWLFRNTKEKLKSKGMHLTAINVLVYGVILTNN